MLKRLALPLTAAALLAPAGAQAHVSLHPNTLPSGSGPTVDVRVPNEMDDANVVKVDMQVPPGVTFLLTQPVAGWNAKVVQKKLAKPIQTDDGPVTEEASEVIWTATKGGGTPPGAFQSFPVALSVPGKAGQVLSFKTLQTYSNGKVVRWIQGPDGENPAPTVNVTAENGFVQEQAGDAGPPAPGKGAASGAAAPAPTATAAPATKTVVKEKKSSNDLAIAALIVAALALAAGGAGLAAARRSAART